MRLASAAREVAQLGAGLTYDSSESSTDVPERTLAATEDAFDAIVVGGGIAGIASAVGLSEAGLRVRLLERDQVLGGRARSFTEPVTGEVLPIGPHVFLDNYANLRALIERLGTHDRV